MRAWLRRWWPGLKVGLAVAVLASVGWQLARDLRRLDLGELALRPGWLAASGLLYLAALGFSAWFWFHLLRAFGQRPAPLATARAYYLGHLGKYLPGKAWALLMRGTMVRGPDVRLGVAIITAFYEVLTTMAAGALVAAVLFAWQPPAAAGLPGDPVLLGVLLLVLVGVPLLPAVFNRLVARLAARFQKVESFRLPRLRGPTLLLGLAATACGWALLGVSLWAVLRAILPEPEPLTGPLWGRCTAMVGLAYVAGFLAVFMPGGVGVREFLLLALLPPLLAGQPVGAPDGVAAAAVLLLRLVWTAAELLLVAVVYWLPGPGLAAVEAAEVAAAGTGPP
jgi:uncharacterized membrane protein YbhN (UPF0104 family)